MKLRRTALLTLIVVLSIAVVLMGIFLYKAGLSTVKPSNKLPSIHLEIGAQAQCQDGYYSYSRGSGTCSSHGGVKTLIQPTKATSTTTAPETAPVASQSVTEASTTPVSPTPVTKSCVVSILGIQLVCK